MVKNIAFLLSLLSATALFAQDWPTYMHDGSRKGIVDTTLKFPLKKSWHYKATYAPEPAWPKPAKQDFWHHLPELTSTTTFDRVFHPIVANKKLYFSSSADNILRCLSASSGKTLWEFFTQGPIHLAPIAHKNKVYVASDDGYLYCVDAKTGKQVWKYWAGGSEKRFLPGNSNLISRWPIRSGLAIAGGNIYFTAGLFQTEKIYLCSVNIDTGKKVYKKSLGSSAQGYLAITNDKLFIPVGRGSQLAIALKNGKLLFALGKGGSSPLVFGDIVISGPSEDGQLSMHSSKSNEIIGTVKGTKMSIEGDDIFLLNKGTISRIDKSAFIKISKEIAVLNKIKALRET